MSSSPSLSFSPMSSSPSRSLSLYPMSSSSSAPLNGRDPPMSSSPSLSPLNCRDPPISSSPSLSPLYGRDPTDILTALSNLSSDDESLRSEAEKLYDDIKNNPDPIFTWLSNQLRSSPILSNRTLAALSFHNLLHRNFWPHLSPFSQLDLKKTFLTSLRTESDLLLLLHLSTASAALATQDEWPELNLFMFQSLLSDESDHKHFLVFCLFIELAPRIGRSLSFYEDELYEVAIKYMDLESENENPYIHAAAARALLSLILYVDDQKFQNEYKDIPVQIMSMTRVQLVGYKHYVCVNLVLDKLIVLAREKTEMLENEFELFFEVMDSIAEEQSADAIISSELAIEFLLTVAEERKLGCGLIEKWSGYLTRFLEILIKMLVVDEDEDDSLWYDVDSADGYNESDKFAYGRESLDRLTVALRGHAIVKNPPEVLADFLINSDWRKRLAAVTALAAISEGSSKVIINGFLELLVDKILLFFDDSHLRVRWAAINAVGQFSKNLGPQLQQQYHQQLVPALTAAMDDSQNARIPAEATSAMQLFCHSCPPDILNPYLKGIVRKLLTFLQKGKKMMRVGALAALASIASSAPDHFQQYYEIVMPYLNLILISGTENANCMLVAKSIDCIIMVGMAVGKEKFSGDAQQVVKVLVSLQQSQLEADDPMRRHLLQAWGRLCKCLGKDFVPYMSVAMPKLLESAQLKSHTIVDTDQYGTEESHYLSMEGATPISERFRVKPYVLEEKALACNILCCCAAELKEGLHMWIMEVAQTLVPLLKFNFKKEIRSAAVTAMPLLLHSTISAMKERLYLPGFDETLIDELPRSIIPALEEALNKESRTEIRAKILDSLNECIQISGYYLDIIQVTHIVDGLIGVLTASAFKITEREKRVKADDLSAGQWELLKEDIEQEEKVCNKVGDLMNTLIKRFKASFLPFLDKLLPVLEHLWGNGETAKERETALLIFSNVARQCREEAFRYYETCLPYLFKACNNENPEVRQVVAHGIGLCAEFGGSVFKPHIIEALSNLEAVVKHPNAQLPENILAYEAAVSAFIKICYFHCDGIKVCEVTSFWLIHLPIRNDLQEAKVVHDQLCSMVQKFEEDFFDPEKEYFSKIIQIFTEIIWAGNNLATEQTVSRMIKLLKQFLHKFTPAKLRSVCSSIPLHQQNMLESILSS